MSDYIGILNKFVAKHMSHNDSSHNVEHVKAVYNNCMTIIKMGEYAVNRRVITFAAYLHDVCDHKYQGSATCTRSELHAFIDAHLCGYEAECVKKIIDNVSYSKEISPAGLDSFDYDLDCKLWRDIVSDADKLEALGHVGLNRCIAYSNAIGDESNVLRHVKEKLLRLLPDGFIRTPIGRHLAMEGHKILVDFYERETAQNAHMQGAQY